MLRDPDWDALEREIFGAVDRRERDALWELSSEIRRRADRISSLILYTDLPLVDIEIEIRELKQFVIEKFPGKEELFDAIYTARFKRLWNQWRESSGSFEP